MYYKTRLHPRKHNEYIIRNKHVDGCVLHELESKKAPTNEQQCSSSSTSSVCSKSTNNLRMYTSMPTLYQPISMGINQKQKQHQLQQQQRKQQTMGMVAGSSTYDICRRRKSMHTNTCVDALVGASDKLMKTVAGGNRTNQIKASVDNINATTIKTTTSGNNNCSASSTTTIKSNSENQFRFFSNADIYDSAYPADCGMKIINNKIRSIDDCRKDKSRSLTNLNKNSVAYKSNTLRGGGGREDDTSKPHLYSIERIENELSKIT